MEYFQTERIFEGVTKITDQYGVYAYLAEGDRQAVLIDTGMGIGSLAGLLDGLTPKPLLVLCTHGHVDHAGGAYGFETVYLSEHDLDLAQTYQPRLPFQRGRAASERQKHHSR